MLAVEMLVACLAAIALLALALLPLWRALFRYVRRLYQEDRRQTELLRQQKAAAAMEAERHSRGRQEAEAEVELFLRSADPQDPGDKR